MTRHRPSLVAAAATTAALVLALTGCGEKSEPGHGAGAPTRLDRFTLVLDYVPNADHAAIYAAQAAGEYRRAGLDVSIQPPPDPSAPLRLLEGRRADLAISYEPEVLLARDRGARIRAVGALVQKPLTSIMALPEAHIARPQDLRGRTVGTAGIPYQSAYLKTILAQAGVDPASVKEVNVGFNLVPAMLGGRVDATLGAFWNYEAIDLQRRHHPPTVIHVENAGVPTYAELVFVAPAVNRDGGAESRIRRFLAATARGHDALVARPAAGVDALLAADHGLDRGLQEASVAATLPAMAPPQGRPFGWQDPREWALYGDWMQRNGLLKRPAHAAGAVTDAYLPGQGLVPEEPGATPR